MYTSTPPMLTMPCEIQGAVIYHYFSVYDNIGYYSDEIDLVLSKQINENISILGKYAYFDSHEPGIATRYKFTVDLTFKF